MAKKNPLANWDNTYKEGDIISVKLHGEGVVRHPNDSGEDDHILIAYVKDKYHYCRFRGFTAWVHEDEIILHKPTKTEQ